MSRFTLILFLIFVWFKISSQTKIELANHWAPYHLQNVCKKGYNSLEGKSDEITRFDFDGDWNALNNWKNLETYDIQSVVYFDVKETENAYFIMYAFFHPRDWTRFRFFGLGQHENDLEGVFLWIAKSESMKWGNLKSVFTIFHNDILVYLPENSNLQLKKSYKARKKRFTLYKERHLFTIQQAKGHGVKLFGDMKLRKDKIWYVPMEHEDSLIKTIGGTIKTFELIDIMSEGELWSQKDNLLFFEVDQTIKGDNGKGANPPWLWKDWNNGKELTSGTLFNNPERFVEVYFEKSNFLDNKKQP